MTLDSLENFIRVVEKRTFTEAARAAHLSQPALTASIQKLEGDVGTRLFIRGARGAELTEAGRTLLPIAREAIAAVARGKRAISELVGLERGRVRIAAGATVCTYYLPHYLALFRKRFGNIQIELREATTTVAQEAVDAGEFDFGIVCADTGDRWKTDELVLVTSPKGPYRGRGFSIETAPFITFPVGSTTRETLLQIFPGARIVMELSGIASVKGNVREGNGIALMSKRAIERDLKARSLAVLTHPKTPIKRALTIIHRGKERMSPAALALYGLLQSE
jgi:DNA-binding transcriptional LysR family regulator